MNKSVINSYRLQPQPPHGTIAGRIVPAATPTYRRALVALAALLLPLLAVGVVVYAARVVQPAPVAVPSPVIVERLLEATPVVVERVVEVQASPVIIIVTATPATPVQAAPRQVSPVAPLRQAAPPTRPQAQPTTAPITRGVTVQPTGPAPTVGPQERLLTRDCVYPSHPQGTVIRGYYTDANGVKRDAICKPDGWKAVQ